MNKKTGAFCISLLLLSTLIFQDLTIAKSGTEEGDIEYYIKSTVTYSNMGDSVWNFTEREEDRTVGLFMNNSWQTVNLVNSTFSIEAIKNDTDGNQVAVLQFPETSRALNAGENTTYGVTYRVVSKTRTLGNINETASESLNEIPESLREKHSGDDRPWLVNDTELRDLAYGIAGSETNVLTLVKNFVDWIAENITYEEQEFPQYPNKTLTEREGDCDDQAILLITLCRIVHIPAFLQIGAIYMHSMLRTSKPYWGDHVTVVQKRIGWHGWAMVYIPPWGWLPVDLTYVFGGLGSDPLNAITNAAVTEQITIQYMNISQRDYVASSREARDFLVTNRFYVYMEDEMIEITRQENPFGDIVQKLFAAVLLVAAALLLVSSYMVARRWKRTEDRPTP